jgi:ATP-dependent DNA helicase PIF1
VISLLSFQTLIAGLKSSKVRVQVTASTGIAATLLIDGMTLHMKLRINNDVESDTLPTVDYESPFAEVLRQCEVLVVDEVSMMDRKVLEYVDRVLRSVEGRSPAAQLPFGGKV